MPLFNFQQEFNNFCSSSIFSSIFSCPSSSIPTLVIHSRLSIHSDRQSRASSQITSNFITRTSKLEVIRISQPPTYLCTASNFLTNTTIETFQGGHLRRHLDRQERKNTLDIETWLSRTLVKGRFRNSCNVWVSNTWLTIRIKGFARVYWSKSPMWKYMWFGSFVQVLKRSKGHLALSILWKTCKK